MRPVLILIAAFLLSFPSCTVTTDVFEKNISIPGQSWSGDFRPDIAFDIADTASLYNIFIVLRHTDAYEYNNLYVRAAVHEPGEKAAKTGDYELTLASNEKGWLGSAMDDIYESRILVQQRTRFNRTGSYHFAIEQLMREDPLKHVLSIGLRLEKIK
jgi:gliding motility-associated lipoprotein GldH